MLTSSWNRVFLSPSGYIWSTMDAAAVSANLYLHRHNTTMPYVAFGYGSSQLGSISTNGSVVSYNTTSDYRLKEHVQPLADSLERVVRLKPISYTFRKDPSHTVVEGFLAHEVQQVVPYAVLGKKDAVGKDGKPVYQQLDYAKLTPLLTSAVQQLKADNDNLREQLKELKAASDELRREFEGYRRQNSRKLEIN